MVKEGVFDVVVVIRYGGRLDVVVFVLGVLWK